MTSKKEWVENLFEDKMSFINRRKSIMKPCGTPALIEWILKTLLSTMTTIYISAIKLPIHEIETKYKKFGKYAFIMNSVKYLSRKI